MALFYNSYQKKKLLQASDKINQRQKPDGITKIGIQKSQKANFRCNAIKVSDHMLVTSHGTCFPILQTRHYDRTNISKVFLPPKAYAWTLAWLWDEDPTTFAGGKISLQLSTKS